MGTFLLVLIIFGSVLELLSLKNSLPKIQYHSSPSKLGCDPEEVFQITSTITNYGNRTIPFLRLEEEFPMGIQILGGENALTNGASCTYSSLMHIRGRQKITRTVQASLTERGLYYLNGCRLFCGDFLGVRENSKGIEQREEIIIFPKSLPDTTIDKALSGYYGDFSTRRFYTEDPILVSSYRDYTGREPMRSISWVQSARRNELMVKEFDHTMDLSVTILLDVYLHWSEGLHTEQIEYCFSMVRTIAEFLEKRKTSYRLISNAYIRNGRSVYEVLSNSGQGQHHFSTLLFTLGRAIPDSYCSIDDLYHKVVKSYSGENAIFYIAPFENEKRCNLVKSLKDRLGCQIYPLYALKKLEEKKDVG